MTTRTQRLHAEFVEQRREAAVTEHWTAEKELEIVADQQTIRSEEQREEIIRKAVEELSAEFTHSMCQSSHLDPDSATYSADYNSMYDRIYPSAYDKLMWHARRVVKVHVPT